MPRITTSICLIIFTLTSFLVFPQNKNDFNKEIIKKDVNFERDSIRARELNTIAGKLVYDELYTQALDTLVESLSIRKRIYGNESYELGAVYSGMGICYGYLGQNSTALKYYDIS